MSPPAAGNSRKWYIVGTPWRAAKATSLSRRVSKKRSGGDRDRGDALPRNCFIGQVDLRVRAGPQFVHLQVESARSLAYVAELVLVGQEARVEQGADRGSL